MNGERVLTRIYGRELLDFLILILYFGYEFNRNHLYNLLTDLLTNEHLYCILFQSSLVYFDTSIGLSQIYLRAHQIGQICYLYIVKCLNLKEYTFYIGKFNESKHSGYGTGVHI